MIAAANKTAPLTRSNVILRPMRRRVTAAEPSALEACDPDVCHPRRPPVHLPQSWPRAAGDIAVAHPESIRG